MIRFLRLLLTVSVFAVSAPTAALAHRAVDSLGSVIGRAAPSERAALGRFLDGDAPTWTLDRELGSADPAELAGAVPSIDELAPRFAALDDGARAERIASLVALLNSPAHNSRFGADAAALELEASRVFPGGSEAFRQRVDRLAAALRDERAAAAPEPASPPPAVETSALAEKTAPKDAQLASPSIASQNVAAIDGQQIPYTATVGFLEVEGEGGAKGRMYYTSYVAPGAQAKDRPVTFVFNGGPGSSSNWLHMGFMGPKRVNLTGEGTAVPQSQLTVDNEYFPIDATDIVLIDPIGAGFSRPNDGVPAEKFFGTINDRDSFASFINSYIENNGRQTSPKFILGESYGGVRSNLLAQQLQAEKKILVDGVIQISPAIGVTPMVHAFDNEVPYWTRFPSMAATAWYHHRLSREYQRMSVDRLFKIARRFARGPLRNALEKGSRLSESELRRLARRMSTLTGVPAKKIMDVNLRLRAPDFEENLLAERGLVVGDHDARFTGPRGNGDDWPEAGAEQAEKLFQSAVESHLFDTLGVPRGMEYKSRAEFSRWNYGEGPLVQSTIVHLMQAMIDNPALRVSVMGGYYDLTVPLESVDYELSRLPRQLTPSSRIELSRHPSGHMIYINPTTLPALKAQLVDFIKYQVALRHLREAADDAQAKSSAPRLNSTHGEFEGPVPFKYQIDATEGSENRDVLYHLHGGNSNERVWADRKAYGAVREAWARLGRPAPIVVSISFGPLWLLAERNASAASGLLEFFVERAMPYVESKLAAPAGRRLLYGMSMGGLNAVELMLKRPGIFERVAIASPAIYSVSPFASMEELEAFATKVGVRIQQLQALLDISKHFLPDERSWRAFDPLTNGKEILDSSSAPLYVSSGKKDEIGFFPGAAALAAIAAEKGASVIWKPLAGAGHGVIDSESLAEFLLPGESIKKEKR